jgi:hypothetical protein
MRVEADLFSGRPNPSWVASPDEAERIAARLAELRAADAPAAMPDGLGYRGMRLSGVASHLHGCDELHLALGSIVAECPDGARGFHDPGRSLERLLVAMAAAHLAPELHGVLRSLAGFD